MEACEGPRDLVHLIETSYVFCYQDKSSPTLYLAQLTTHIDLSEILKSVLAFLEPSCFSPSTVIYSEFVSNNKQGPACSPLWLHKE